MRASVPFKQAVPTSELYINNSFKIDNGAEINAFMADHDFILLVSLPKDKSFLFTLCKVVDQMYVAYHQYWARHIYLGLERMIDEYCSSRIKIQNKTKNK